MKELGHEDSTSVLTQAITANPRKVELYYLAARVQLSKPCGDGSNAVTPPGEGSVSVRDGSGVKSAVEWLVKCVRQFYVDTPPEMSTKLVLILYR